ncbi:Rv2175c family DNA-binding protein [Bailinhaonella thermotolerans]|uniref:DNA-binding protein n=1 Tax=Bailinhaonella thermotolerans TaxID=1070861 RepID=A0A3A4BB00_9ACTN|nr:Rv2175c family DNA-binding protein [Bailinhaonella thermotolerans]RJL31378.1 DNA-binding protein [Bailinhaonella thermotolerans]
MTLSVAQIDRETEQLVGQWITLPEAAQQLGISLGRAKQYLRDRKLIGVHRDRQLCVPAVFIKDGQILKGLSGTLTVLADAGYDEVASLRWLFTADDSLPGSPAEALVAGRHSEVNRRAQALAF